MKQIQIPIEDIKELALAMENGETYQERPDDFKRYDMIFYKSQLDQRFNEFFDTLIRILLGGQELMKTRQDIFDFEEAKSEIGKQDRKLRYIKSLGNFPKISEENSDNYVVGVNQLIFKKAAKELQVIDSKLQSRINLPEKTIPISQLEVVEGKFYVEISKDTYKLLEKLIEVDIKHDDKDKKVIHIVTPETSHIIKAFYQATDSKE